MNKLASIPNSQTLPADEFVGKITAKALNDLMSMVSPLSCPANIVLFSEKALPQRVFMIFEGQVKLSINSSDGKRLILRIARKGEIVGIASALSGNSYEMTAETLCPSKLAPIGRREFLAFLIRHPEAYQTLAEELSSEFSVACEQLRMLGLSTTAPEKLARFLLEWSENGQKTASGTCCQLSLTHDEIGEHIGASRETVTRAMGVFRNLRLITFQGSTLTIPNKTALEIYARN